MKYTFQTDDEWEARNVLHANNMRGDLCEIFEFCRGKIKHCDLSEEVSSFLQEIKEVAAKWIDD